MHTIIARYPRLGSIRKYRRFLGAAALLGATAATAYGQESQPIDARGDTWVEFGVALGTRGIAVTGGSDLDSIPPQEFLGLRAFVGKNLGSHFRLGVGAMIWAGEVHRSSGATLAVIGTARLYLMPQRGLSIRAGLGYVKQGGEFLGVDAHLSGPAILVGMGYDFGLGSSSTLGLYFEALYVPRSSVSGTGADGFAVLEQLLDEKAVVIVFSGQGQVKEAVRAMRRGAENFLTKPVELDHPAEAVERAAEKAERSHELRVMRQRHPRIHGRRSGPFPLRWKDEAVDNLVL